MKASHVIHAFLPLLLVAPAFSQGVTSELEISGVNLTINEGETGSFTVTSVINTTRSGDRFRARTATQPRNATVVVPPGQTQITFNVQGNVTTNTTGSSFQFTPTDEGQFRATVTGSVELERNTNEFVGSFSINKASNTITVLNVAPVFTLTPPALVEAEVGETVLLSARATDPGADTLTYLWDLNNDGTIDFLGEDLPITATSEFLSVAAVYVSDGDGGFDSHGFVLNFFIDPPKIENVILGSSSWSAGFIANVGSVVGKSNSEGYSLVGTDQLVNLPFTNLDTLFVKFDDDIGSLGPNEISVNGINVTDYASRISSVTYNPQQQVATIQFNEPLTADRLTVSIADGVLTDTNGHALDGEWSSGVSTQSGDGTAGGEFSFSFNVLPGDVTGDDIVLANDIGLINARSFAAIGNANYATIFDINGDGIILSNDVGLANIRSFTSLPPVTP